jgi:hypothetical protein
MANNLYRLGPRRRNLRDLSIKQRGTGKTCMDRLVEGDLIEGPPPVGAVPPNTTGVPPTLLFLQNPCLSKRDGIEDGMVGW